MSWTSIAARKPASGPTDQPSSGPRSAAASRELSAKTLALRDASAIPLNELLNRVRTTNAGLSEIEAVLRREEGGPNEVAHQRPPRWYAQLGRASSDRKALHFQTAAAGPSFVRPRGAQPARRLLSARALAEGRRTVTRRTVNTFNATDVAAKTFLRTEPSHDALRALLFRALL
jgi:hypothetical protein